MTSTNTMPKTLRANYEKFGESKIAMRKKEFGYWGAYTWSDIYEKVKHFSLGLICLGLKPGDKLTIIGDNDPQWFWAEYATQAMHGIPVGMFADSNAEEVKYILKHSGSQFVAVNDQEQVDKVLEVQGELPQLQKIIYWDPKGLHYYDNPLLAYFDDVALQGKEYEQSHPGSFEHNIETTSPSDVGLITYTSGTTGYQKGVIWTHDALLASLDSLSKRNPLFESDELVSFIPPGWVVEQLLAVVGLLHSRVTVDFIEEPDTTQENVREISPPVLVYTSRLWEAQCSVVQAKINDASFLKRLTYGLWLRIGYKLDDLSLNQDKSTLTWKVLRGIAATMVLTPLRDKLGLANVRDGYTGGAILSPDAFRFYRALGINMKQLYGGSETGIVTCHGDGDSKSETVGPPVPGVDMRITDEGEIASRPPYSPIGYYNDDETTKSSFKRGYFYSGDAGFINEWGHLIVIDRMKDLAELASGGKFSPQYIESRLKFSPYVKDGMAIGGRERGYVTSILVFDYDNVGRWAERRRLAYTTYADLSQRAEVAELLRKDIERVNRTLPDVSRVRKFVVLHKEFDADEAELTRTRKLRRFVVEDRYKDMIDAMYGDASEITVEAEVVYRDRTKATTATAIKINTVQ